MSNALGSGETDLMPGRFNVGDVSYFDVGKGFARFAAGVDCVAFVYRSFSYGGSEYGILTGDNAFRFLRDGGNGSVYWEENRVGLRYPYPGDGNAEMIADRQNFERRYDPVKDDYVSYWPNLSYVKPGDLMYYDYTGPTQAGGDNPGSHLAMVQEVVDANGNGEIEPGEVKLVESTFTVVDFQTIGNATNVRTLATPGIVERSWVIVRLK